MKIMEEQYLISLCVCFLEIFILQECFRKLDPFPFVTFNFNKLCYSCPPS